MLLVFQNSTKHENIVEPRCCWIKDMDLFWRYLDVHLKPSEYYNKHSRLIHGPLYQIYPFRACCTLLIVVFVLQYLAGNIGSKSMINIFKCVIDTKWHWCSEISGVQAHLLLSMRHLNNVIMLENDKNCWNKSSFCWFSCNICISACLWLFFVLVNELLMH